MSSFQQVIGIKNISKLLSGFCVCVCVYIYSLQNLVCTLYLMPISMWNSPFSSAQLPHVASKFDSVDLEVL